MLYFLPLQTAVLFVVVFYPVKPVHVSKAQFDLSVQTDAKLGHK